MRLRCGTILAAMTMFAAFDAVADLHASGDARWIWYPGDYGLWWGNELQSQRLQYGSRLTPFWPMYAPEPRVMFRKSGLNLAADEPLDVRCDGHAAFCWTDDRGVYHESSVIGGRFLLPKSAKKIEVKIQNTARPPRTNNRGCIATVIPEKPHVGDWRSLVDGLFALEYAPLLEMRTGSGSVTLCQLDVTARTVADPAADAIVSRLVSYRRGGVGPKRPDFLGREAEMAGYAWGVKSWENGKDLVVSSGAKVPDDLGDRVAKGATVLCLGLGADEAKAWSCGEALDIAPTNGCVFSRIENPPPELNGLSNADFFWHGAMDFAAFQNARPDGNAAFRVVRHGKGRIVYWQLPPWRFDTDARPHQRPSRRAASRFFARLMCNLGWETFTDGTGFHKRPQYKDIPVPDDDPYVWVNL